MGFLRLHKRRQSTFKLLQGLLPNQTLAALPYFTMPWDNRLNSDALTLT